MPSPFGRGETMVNYEDPDFIPVIFRKDRREKDVYALFPTLPASVLNDTCECETQHGSTGADYALCIAQSVPAQPEEYAPMLEKIRNLSAAGTRVVVYQKANHRMHTARRAEIRRLRALAYRNHGKSE